MCRVGDESTGMNLSHESLTSALTLRKLQSLQSTHPNLYSKLVAHDAAPDPVTATKRARRRAPKSKPSNSKRRKGKSASRADSDFDSAGEYEDEEKIETEEEDSPFDDKVEFEDDLDVPVELIVEHVVAEGSVDGLSVQEDGGLRCSEDRDGEEAEEDVAVPSTDADIDLDVPLAQRHQRRPKMDPRWYQKDWLPSGNLIIRDSRTKAQEIKAKPRPRKKSPPCVESEDEA
jgi:hypothetical protein